MVKPGPTNTLLGWIGGTGAIEMENCSDQEIVNRCIQLLEKFMKKSIPNPIKYYW